MSWPLVVSYLEARNLKLSQQLEEWEAELDLPVKKL